MGFVIKNNETGLYAKRVTSDGSWVENTEDALQYNIESNAEIVADIATDFLEQECIVEVV